MENIKIFKEIIKRIDITPEKMILLDGKQHGGNFNNAYTAKPSNKMMFDQLQTLLYTEFYCGTDPIKQNPVTDYMKLEEEIEAFNTNLSKFNHSKERMDTGWVVDQIDTSGAMTAIKGNLKRPVAVGEFLNDSAFGRNTGEKESIKLYMRKEYQSPGSGFYYIFGTTAGEENMDMLVRIYFNIQPKAVEKLIGLLTKEFNVYSIPFSFKCLNHPSYYTRKDTAVLYIDKKYYRIATEILSQNYAVFKNEMMDATPLFTKKLATGIAFAENPLKMEESFGTHCCKMITQAIIGAWNKKLPKTAWLDEIKYTIEKLHFYPSCETLYKNPESRYPYDFTIFKN